MRGCSVAGCERPHGARGFCPMHYMRFSRTEQFVKVGNTDGTTAEQKFWPNVYKTASCWFWIGRLNEKGYGICTLERNSGVFKAHRLSWLIHHGIVPKGMHLMHSCDIRQCVNPEHLRVGTVSENAKDRCARGIGNWGLTDEERLLFGLPPVPRHGRSAQKGV